ncbi:MAG: hypothetical protein IJK09_03950 [Prevotella sp.]|nr:hypothetical protein [Prevotella sp.]
MSGCKITCFSCNDKINQQLFNSTFIG